MKTLIAFICQLFFVTLAASAQTSATDSLLRANSYAILYDSTGNMSGTGVEFLLKNTADAQFVLIGENHNTKEIPQFTASLFDMLHDHYGFAHLALEQDPMMMQKVSAKPWKGNADSVFSLARRYKYGFTFIDDEELRMIALVSAYQAKGNSVWGCDQLFGVSQLLDKIRPGKRDVEFDSLKARAKRTEADRDLEKKHFVSQQITKADLKVLRKYRTGDPASDVDFGIHSLTMSDSIFTLMRTERSYDGCAAREQYMKNRFMEEYNKSKAAGEKMPKVVLKFGNSHTMDGFEPNTGTVNVGTFVRQLAIANGMTSFSMYAKIYRTDSSDWNYNNYEGKEVMNMFARNAPIDQWTLFDLRPLKAQYFNSGLKEKLSKENREFLEHVILVYDALLMIGNGNDGTFTVCKCEY